MTGDAAFNLKELISSGGYQIQKGQMCIVHTALFVGQIKAKTLRHKRHILANFINKWQLNHFKLLKFIFCKSGDQKLRGECPGGTHLRKRRVCKAGDARPLTFSIAQIRKMEDLQHSKRAKNSKNWGPLVQQQSKNNENHRPLEQKQ